MCSKGKIATVFEWMFFRTCKFYSLGANEVYKFVPKLLEIQVCFYFGLNLFKIREVKQTDY